MISKVSRNCWSVIMPVMASIVLLVSGCGTTISHTPTGSDAPHLARDDLYIMGSCKMPDEVSADSICRELQEQIQYGLFKSGLYKPGGLGATKRIDLKIASIRSASALVQTLGPLSGGVNMEIVVDVVDEKSGEVVDQSAISTSDYTAMKTTVKTMIRRVSNELVKYLSGVRNSKQMEQQSSDHIYL